MLVVDTHGPVFHEAQVADTGHPGAAHALAHPAHHEAQDAFGRYGVSMALGKYSE